MTDTITIDLDDGRTVPLTPTPYELGEGFAAVFAEALSWSPERRAEVQQLNDQAAADDAYTDAAERVGEAFYEAGLSWSCQFGEPDAEVEAQPYIETLTQKVSVGAGDVAAAVLTRDLRLITEADFATLTGWWTAAGLPLPHAGYTALRLAGVNDNTVLYAADADEVLRNAQELNRDRYRLGGWPMTAVCGLGTTITEGRYSGHPGLNWYRTARNVVGAELAVGDDLDTDDRRGSRRILSIPAEQPTDGTRIVVIGFEEEVTVQLDGVYRVVDLETLVDLDVERPYVFRGGPLDGQVTYEPRAIMPGHCLPTTNGNVSMTTWASADSWPADVERYAPALGENAQDEPEAVVMVWRRPTGEELDRARQRREQRDADKLADIAADV